MADKSGPAFPSEQGTDITGNWNQTYEPGMTLRQWYAGLAMQAIISKIPIAVVYKSDLEGGCQMAAKGAFDYADAMLAESSK